MSAESEPEEEWGGEGLIRARSSPERGGGGERGAGEVEGIHLGRERERERLIEGLRSKMRGFRKENSKI